jgi:hypothetical protein
MMKIGLVLVCCVLLAGCSAQLPALGQADRDVTACAVDQTWCH